MGEQYIIYVDNCLLHKGIMAKKNIIFKKYHEILQDFK